LRVDLIPILSDLSSSHIKFAAIDGRVAILGSGNQDTQVSKAFRRWLDLTSEDWPVLPFSSWSITLSSELVPLPRDQRHGRFETDRSRMARRPQTQPEYSPLRKGRPTRWNLARKLWSWNSRYRKRRKV